MKGSILLSLLLLLLSLISTSAIARSPKYFTEADYENSTIRMSYQIRNLDAFGESCAKAAVAAVSDTLIIESSAEELENLHLQRVDVMRANTQLIANALLLTFDHVTIEVSVYPNVYPCVVNAYRR